MEAENDGEWFSYNPITFIAKFRTDMADTSPVSCYGTAKIAWFIGTSHWEWQGRIIEVDRSTRSGGIQTHVYVIFDEVICPLNIATGEENLTKEEILAAGVDVTEWVMSQPLGRL
ncbi:hypothetical protein ACFLY9_01390 [Patescibacteria group bacterium]